MPPNDSRRPLGLRNARRMLQLAPDIAAVYASALFARGLIPTRRAFRSGSFTLAPPAHWTAEEIGLVVCRVEAFTPATFSTLSTRSSTCFDRSFIRTVPFPMRARLYWTILAPRLSAHIGTLLVPRLGPALSSMFTVATIVDRPILLLRAFEAAIADLAIRSIATIEPFTATFMSLSPVTALVALASVTAVETILSLVPLTSIVAIAKALLVLLRRLSRSLKSLLRLVKMPTSPLLASLTAFMRPMLMLAMREPGYRWLLRLPKIFARSILIDIVAVRWKTVLPHACLIARLRVLQSLLFPICQDDPIVMLGMLEVILCQHRITRRQSVTCQRHVLFGNVGRSTTDLYIWPVRLIATRQRILAFALIIVVIVIVVPATSAAMLLSLPHGLSFSH